MKNLLLFLVVLAFLSCRKKEKEAFPGLNGTWVGIGSTYSSGSITPPDAFYPIRVRVIDANSIAVFSDTLPYDAAISNDDSAVFNVVSTYYPALNYTMLVYNKRSQYVVYSSSAGSSSGHGSTHLSSAGYHSNPLLKGFIQKLSGNRTLSGIFHEVSFYPAKDTTYDTTLQVNFTVVNDSTIAFDKSITEPGGDTLHYKRTGNAATNVVFEVFHIESRSITTLEYDAITNAVSLREWARDFPRVVDVELK